MKRSISALVFVALACSPSNPAPLGGLQRPSGLLYITRTATVGSDGNPVGLADLYIADSLAQGVRVLQLSRTIPDPPIYPSSNSALDAGYFVPAPVVYFPLVIPADGFPTRLAQSKVSQNVPGDPARIFALAPYTSMIYVIEADQVPYYKGPTFDKSNNVVGRISIADAFPEPSIPTAFGTIALANGDDGILVAFEVIGVPGAAIAAFDIHKNADGTFARVGTPEVARIQPAPQDMIVRKDGIVAISSGDLSSTDITVIATSPTAPILKNVSSENAGGPTTGLIDAENVGVFALRLDRPSLVLFNATKTATRPLARSTLAIASPYTLDAEYADADYKGRIDLPPYPIVSGAYGRMPFLFDQPVMPLPSGQGPVNLLRTGSPTDYSMGGPGFCAKNLCGDVVEITEENGHAALLVGNPPRLAVTSSASVTRAVVNEGPAFVDGCPFIQGPICTLASDFVLDQPDCHAPFVINYGTYTGDTMRATYKGPLATSRNATLRLALTSTTGTPHFLLDDGTIFVKAMLPGFTDRQIRPGDAVDLQMRFPKSDMSLVEAVERGRVVSVISETELEVVFPARTSSVSRRWPHPAGDKTAEPIAVYEVYPSTEDAVFAIVNGRGVTRVLERKPIYTETVKGTLLTRAAFSTRLTMTMTSSSGFHCADDFPPGKDPSNPGAEGCTIDTDCPASSVCAASITGASSLALKGCLGYCTGSCDPTSQACVSLERVRRCTSVELSIAPVVASSPTFFSTTGFQPSAPDQTVFSPLNLGFITSFPGARGVAEIRSDPTLGFTPLQFR